MPIDWISHYGLREDPFADIGPDGPFLQTPQIGQRLNLLLHLVQYSELMLAVVGSRGSGKTTLLQRLLADAGPRWRPCVIEGDPELDPDALLTQILSGFEIREHASGAAESMGVLEAFLQGLRRGSTRAVLVVDDAHLLPPASIEQLTRIAAERKRLGLAMAAFGEPPLLERVVRSAGSNLLHVIDIPPLTEEQVAEYVDLRLSWAGLKVRSPFGREALHVIAKTSRGLPGLLNPAARQFLSNRAEAGARGLQGLMRAGIRAVAEHRLATAGVALGAAIVGAGTYWLLAGPALPPAPVPSSIPISGGPTRPSTATPLPVPPLRPPAPPVELLPPSGPVSARLPTAPPGPAATPPRAPAPGPAASGPGPTRASGESLPASPAPTAPSATAPSATAREGAVPGRTGEEPREPARGADETWLLAQPGGNYTVQIFGSHDVRATERFKNSYRLKDRTAVYRTGRDGKDWYVIVVGSYGTREAAQRAIQGLPPEVKRNNPWPRNLASVQESIRQAPPRN